MLNDIAIFGIILVTSLIAKNLLLGKNIGPFTSIVNYLRFLGVAVHEISHFTMCLAVGVLPKSLKIKYRSAYSRRPDPHGVVSHTGRISFLQTSVISLAPLYISTWLCFFSLNIAFTSEFNPFVRIFAGFFCVSLLLGAAPSTHDFKNLPRAFTKDPTFSTYQIILVLISTATIWFSFQYFQWVYFYDFVYYIIIGFFYLFLRYSILGTKFIFQNLFGRDSKFSYSAYTRRRHKPTKEELSDIDDEDFEW